MKVMMICVMDNVDIFHEIKIFNLGLQDYELLQISQN